jgi:hypothetical protein
MIRLIAAVLVLAGILLGTYAMLSGDFTDARASELALLTTATAPDAPAVVKKRPSPSVAKTDPPETMPKGELKPRIPVALHSLSSSAPPDTFTLTREIQLQLKRVGCYQGTINGVWSPVVIRSMKAFADHVNAVLPVQHPDIILLALVQNHRGNACGLSCPAGQVRGGDGRCLPEALMANTSKKKPRIEADLRTSVLTPGAAHGKTAERRLAGRRMSLGASQLELVKAKAPRKRSAKRRAHARVRATEARRDPANPYSRHSRWAARAFGPL